MLLIICYGLSPDFVTRYVSHEFEAICNGAQSLARQVRGFYESHFSTHSGLVFPL